MKTDGAVSELFAVDLITAETKKFFRDNFTNDLNDNDYDFLGGKQSGLAASLFSACAFRSAAADKALPECDKAAAQKRADAAAGYLNTQPHIAAFGRAAAENGYINFYCSETYLKTAIDCYAREFDKLQNSGIFEKYLYGNDSSMNGMMRYCINRIISVCEMFSNNSHKNLDYADGFKSALQRELAEHITFALGKKNISVASSKRLADFTAELFFNMDSCIKNASMIYLDLYKSCAYAVHELHMREVKC